MVSLCGSSSLRASLQSGGSFCRPLLVVAAVVVDVELGQRTDVDFELALHRERAGQPVVESVDSPMTSTVPFPAVRSGPLESSLAGLKIEDRQIDALARSSSFIAVKQLHIQRFQTFQIVPRSHRGTDPCSHNNYIRERMRL